MLLSALSQVCVLQHVCVCAKECVRVALFTQTHTHTRKDKHSLHSLGRVETAAFAGGDMATENGRTKKIEVLPLTSLSGWRVSVRA